MMRRQGLWHRFLFFVYSYLYYGTRPPGGTKGRLLDGVRDASWDMLCGWGLRSALGLANIHWKSRAVTLFVSMIPFKTFTPLQRRGPRKWHWTWRLEHTPTKARGG